MEIREEEATSEIEENARELNRDSSASRERDIYIYKLGRHGHSRGHFAVVLLASRSIGSCGLLRNSLRVCESRAVSRAVFARVHQHQACGRRMTNGANPDDRPEELRSAWPIRRNRNRETDRTRGCRSANVSLRIRCE